MVETTNDASWIFNSLAKSVASAIAAEEKSSTVTVALRGSHLMLRGFDQSVVVPYTNDSSVCVATLLRCGEFWQVIGHAGAGASELSNGCGTHPSELI